ncbi:MAG: hypothetical protein RL722_2634, partial [Pseudomonadota bacterium]
RGDAAGLAIWPLAELVLALQKLAVDLSRLAVGAAPRHFAPELLAPLLQAASGPATAAASADLAARQSLLQGLTGWAAALRNRQRRADHPFSLPLAIEALVIEARQALGLT